MTIPIEIPFIGLLMAGKLYKPFVAFDSRLQRSGFELGNGFVSGFFGSIIFGTLLPSLLKKIWG